MPLRDEKKLRRAAVAGQFYSADPLLLRRQLAETEIERGVPSKTTAPGSCGVVLPHAGYMFSLPTAMRTLGCARNRQWKRAVILGPSHHIGFHGIAFSDFDSWGTPFGELSSDQESAEQLLSCGSPLLLHRNDAHQMEHSLEVQFPLVQYFFGNLPVLPLVIGQLNLNEARELGKRFAIINSPETLWIISSDFIHYGNRFRYTPFGEPVRENMRRIDREAAERIAARDLDGFAEVINRTGATICGLFPIALYLGMLETADPEGRITGKIVDHTDSGEISGDYANVVDYVGIAFGETTV